MERHDDANMKDVCATTQVVAFVKPTVVENGANMKGANELLPNTRLSTVLPMVAENDVSSLIVTEVRVVLPTCVLPMVAVDDARNPAAPSTTLAEEGAKLTVAENAACLSNARNQQQVLETRCSALPMGGADVASKMVVILQRDTVASTAGFTKKTWQPVTQLRTLGCQPLRVVNRVNRLLPQASWHPGCLC